MVDFIKLRNDGVASKAKSVYAFVEKNGAIGDKFELGMSLSLFDQMSGE